MRILKLQMHMTVDGFVGRADGGIDWAASNLDEKLRHRMLQNLNGVDCILMAMGRKSEMKFIPYWASVAANPKDPFHAYGKKLTEVTKVVLSNNPALSEWPRTTVINGDFIEETRKLKRLNGGDIIVFGGARFASSMIANRLVDEMDLLVNPVAIGNGLPIFQDVVNKMEMTLAEATPFGCGIVWLNYNIKKPATDS